MSIYEDLLTPPVIGRPRGRPRKVVAARPAAEPLGDLDSVINLDAHLANSRLDLSTLSAHRVAGGVSIAWLMQAFRMGRVAVEKALAAGRCLPTSSTRNGGHLYDLPDAAACLVVPKTDLKAYLRTLKANDLPEHMQEGYWNAKLKEQTFRRLAGELWSTTAVLNVFASTFKAIKEQTQLWPDTLESKVNLTPQQHKALTFAIDQLLDDIRANLLTAKEEGRTLSQLGEVEVNELDDI